jgi:hypothetical protein
MITYEVVPPLFFSSRVLSPIGHHKTMQSLKMILRGLVLTGLALYAIQLTLAIYWRVVPIEQREHGGRIYRIEHGFWGRGDFFPGVAFFALGDEPVRLYVTDKTTGENRAHSYDLAIDIYADFPDVFPDKQQSRYRSAGPKSGDTHLP